MADDIQPNYIHVDPITGQTSIEFDNAKFTNAQIDGATINNATINNETVTGSTITNATVTGLTVTDTLIAQGAINLQGKLMDRFGGQSPFLFAGADGSSQAGHATLSWGGGSSISFTTTVFVTGASAGVVCHGIGCVDSSGLAFPFVLATPGIQQVTFRAYVPGGAPAGGTSVPLSYVVWGD